MLEERLNTKSGSSTGDGRDYVFLNPPEANNLEKFLIGSNNTDSVSHSELE